MDYDYLKQMNDGLDRNALLDELMVTYGKEVWNYAFFLTRRRELAEDIAQDSFIKAYHHIYSYRGDRSMKAWLLAITRNTARDYFKSAWFRKVQFIPEDFGQGLARPSAENEWFGTQRQREIWNAVLELPRKLRETLLLYAHHQLSIKEISELTQLSEGTVKSRLFRARAVINRTFGKSAVSEGRDRT
ncbi:sigma-70 family RNA polymerase sigma factor [Cohnella panacarvi]|uniref:sigma-70 family RNA polymerase sigma factor n=1 Tax=Cohnella panacarvi TaxID=400776 RepID=UPI00047D4CD1|nr:sigma-70 family RNA polymerase sigma factor [Cohnella panacarvi]